MGASVIFVPVHAITDVIQIPACGVNHTKSSVCDPLDVCSITLPNLDDCVRFYLEKIEAICNGVDFKIIRLTNEALHCLNT